MNTPSATIRDLTDADLHRVLEINQANVPEVGDVDLDRLRFIVDESAIALVVETPAGANVTGANMTGANMIAGFCVVLPPGSTYDSVNYRWFMERYDDAYYLDRVAFDATTQGRGLGSALYRDLDRRLTNSDMALTLEVNIDPPNEPSLAFHRKHGFVEVGRQMSKGIEVSLMRKDR